MRVHVGAMTLSLVAGLFVSLYLAGVVSFEAMVGWQLYIGVMGIWRVVQNTDPRS